MKWVMCAFLCLLSASLSASLQVRISDPNTLEPSDFVEVMVGSRASLVVHSDNSDYRSCGLFIEGQDRAIGSLQARGKDPNSRDWIDSHLTAAGPNAYVLQWKDSLLWGFDLYPDDDNFKLQAGKWFVIDYSALEEGVCHVGYYDHRDASWTEPDPNVPPLCFINTPSRDLNADGYVNLNDFAFFSTYWQATNCDDPNSSCYQADFSRNGSVGLEDVVMFADYWLYGNPGWKPYVDDEDESDANQSDPNITTDLMYAIVDVNSLSEITLQTGQSIRLYITQSSISDSSQIFDMDAVITDPNMGWIDVTPDSSDTLAIEGTAEILAFPRMDYFDYYGPSWSDPNAIQFFAATIASSFMDGPMASFVYTAAQPGDVTLELANYASVPAELHAIKIHQVEPLAEKLQRIYLDSPELQIEIPEAEWNTFIESVDDAQ